MPPEARCLSGQAVITIRITPDFGGDKAASGLEVVVPMPREVARVHCELGRDAKSGAAGQTWDWQERARRLVWKFKRVQGSLEHTLRVRLFALHALMALSVHVMGISVHYPACM